MSSKWSRITDLKFHSKVLVLYRFIKTYFFDFCVHFFTIYLHFLGRYPVILSLENHCSIPQQDKMAEYIHKYLDDVLFVGPVKTSDRACPSPDFLRNKVLIKAKKLPGEVREDAEVEDDDVSDTEGDDVTAAGGEARVTPDAIDGAVLSMGKRKEAIKLSKALSDCVYLKATKFSKFGGNEDGKVIFRNLL